jgi:hypothetical protein
LKLLAGMIWAQLGEPDAVVEESAPNELSVRVQDLSWKVTVDEDGRVTISGFDSGAEQYIGEIPQEDSETQIVKISEHVHQLISEDIDKKSVPAEPPVHFGPEDTDVTDQTQTQPPPPAAPGGDMGAVAPDQQAIPPDLGVAPGGEGFPPASGGAGAPAPGGPPVNPAPAAPGVGVPPAQTPFPAASRRSWRLPGRVVRVAHARLEDVSSQLEEIGESLGDDGEEVFAKLAERVRQVVDLIE